MIRELSHDPDSGLLGVTKGMLGGGPALVQYWRSFDDLERFARNPDTHHLPAWRAFNQRVRASGDVGIWHETYRVRAGEYEAIYGNMPRIGLAGAADHKPLEPTSTAAQRIRVRPDDHPPVGGIENPPIQRVRQPNANRGSVGGGVSRSEPAGPRLSAERCLSGRAEVDDVARRGSRRPAAAAPMARPRLRPRARRRRRRSSSRSTSRCWPRTRSGCSYRRRRRD